MASSGSGLWGFLFWMCLSLGTGVLLWALFSDRSRGIPRCPKCWYDLRGVLARCAGVGATEAATGGAGSFGAAGNEHNPTCPECGRSCKDHASLHRTRRHWRRALLAAVPLLGAWLSSSMGAGVREKGWPRLVPTTILCALPPFDEFEWARLYLRGEAESDGWRRRLLDDFVARAEEHRVSDWQVGLWMWRARVALSRMDRWTDHDSDKEVLRRLESNIIRDQGGTITRQQAVDLISRQTGVEFDVDWSDGEGGSTASTLLPPASLDGFPADAAIGRTFAGSTRGNGQSLGDCAWTARNGRVLAKSWVDPQRPERVLGQFDVSDLAARELRRIGVKHRSVRCALDTITREERIPDSKLREEYIESLRRVVTATVHPELWLENGGDDASARFLGNRMLVLAPEGVHTRIHSLLDQLRHPCDNTDRASDPDALREARAEYEALSQRRLSLPESVNSLSTLLAHLRERERLIVCEDSAFRLWTARDRALIDTPRLFAQDHPDPEGTDRAALLGAFSLSEVLDRACMDLTLRGRDFVTWWSRAGVVIIGTSDLYATDRRTITYDISDLIDPQRVYSITLRIVNSTPELECLPPGTDDRTTADMLADELRSLITRTIEPESWQDNGGDTAAILFISDRFVITAPMRTHLQLAELLTLLRNRTNRF